MFLTEDEEIQIDKIRTQVYSLRKDINEKLYALDLKLDCLKSFRNILDSRVSGHTNLATDIYIEYEKTKDLYGLMNADYIGIGNSIKELIFILNINSAQYSLYDPFYPHLLALLMRNIIEESAQMRYIFYKNPKTDTVIFDKENLNTVFLATQKMDWKTSYLKKINDKIDLYQKGEQVSGGFKDYNDTWFKNVGSPVKMVKFNLPDKYEDLYSILCNYSHNSKVQNNLEDTIFLLNTVNTDIIPIINELNEIYSHYFTVFI